MDNIPSVESEQPITVVMGNVLKHPATHARIAHLWPSAKDEELPEKERHAIELYLANFCRPVQTLSNQVACNSCGTELKHPKQLHLSFGAKVMEVSDSGESKCPVCAYPVRHTHVIPSLDGRKILVNLDFFPMCYHPHALEMK